MQLQVIVNNMNEESKHQSESIALKCDGPLLVNGNNRNKKNSNSFDGKESWFVCICCMFANVIVIGCVYIYGIFFPFLLDEFQGGKTKTGKHVVLRLNFISCCSSGKEMVSLPMVWSLDASKIWTQQPNLPMTDSQFSNFQMCGYKYISLIE